MKKLIAVSVFLFLIAGAVSAQIASGRTAWVSVKTVTLKSSTWFFASSRGTIAYGAEVSVLQTKGNWAEIRAAGNSGWIAVSNLSSKRIIASGSSSGVTAGEAALAGKGFNQEVENAYRTQGNLNYADVDRTEAIAVSESELLLFMRDGRLITGEN
jgi:beta-lactamase class A